MGSLGFERRGAASQLAGRLSVPTLALPALLFAWGCNQPVEPDPASRGLENSSTSSDMTDLGDGIVAGAQPGLDKMATVPNASPELPEAELPEAELEPLDAPPEKLGIGDESPGLQIAKWIKGDPVDEPLSGKVHVVEFWATWCGPCRVGMPHISALQTEYGDEVAFIGVTREKEETVAKFLEKSSPDGRTWDEVIQYRLAIDDRGWSNTAYMRAASQNGIPCAFVVGSDGVVEWIGHPGRIDEPLKQIVEGNWDREAAIVEYKRQERLKEMSSKLSGYARSKDWESALELLGQLEDETGKSKGLLTYRLMILESAGRTEEASLVRAELVEDAWDDAGALNEIAWKAATSRKAPDFELALKAAERASELRENKDPAVLDTVARCYFELGKLDEAIKWQRLAVEHNNGHKAIDATLTRYLKEKSQAEETESPEESVPDESESTNQESTE